MSHLTYLSPWGANDKPLVWLSGEVTTPPFSQEARLEAGFLLRRLQRGETLGLPHARPMPLIGRRCYELRINDDDKTWRIVYSLEVDAVVVLKVFAKKSRATPKRVIDTCSKRLDAYRRILREE